MAGINFLDQFLGSLPANGVIVDLGSGIGKYATQMAQTGHPVIAVDKKPYPVEYPGVEFVTLTAEDWLNGLPSTYQASGYLLRNLIQFMEKGYVLQTLLPLIASHLHPGGAIGIITFTAPPQPPFDPPHKYLYSASEILQSFPGWEVILSEEVEEDKPDMSGMQRHFSLTRVIVRKP